jgi:hypothetical protein
MISLYQDPEGNTIFGKSVPGSSVAGTVTYNTQSVELLKARIKELENLVASLNVSLKKSPSSMHEENEIEKLIYSPISVRRAKYNTDALWHP